MRSGGCGPSGRYNTLCLAEPELESVLGLGISATGTDTRVPLGVKTPLEGVGAVAVIHADPAALGAMTMTQALFLSNANASGCGLAF